MISDEQYSYWYTIGVDPVRGVGVFFEEIIESIYTNILEPGDFAVDGGANRGRHTLPMAAIVGREGLVVGIEAIPSLAAALTGRVDSEGWKNIAIVSEAIGQSDGEISFVYVPEADGYSGRLQRGGIPESALTSIQTIPVHMSTIDRIVSDTGRGGLRFIKLDLEGGEYNALQGAASVMDNDKPFIVFENGRAPSAHLYQYSMDQWFLLFSERGYKVFDLFGRVFGPEQWNAVQIPFYFIAAAREEDLIFLRNNLSNLISGLLEQTSDVL